MTHLCAIRFILLPPSMLYSCLNCMFLSTVSCVLTSGFRLCSHDCQKTCFSCVLLLLFKTSVQPYEDKSLLKCHMVVWCSLQKDQHWTAWTCSHDWLSLLIILLYFSFVLLQNVSGFHPLTFFLMIQVLPQAVSHPLQWLTHLWMQDGLSALLADVNPNQCNSSILSNHVLLSISSWNDLCVTSAAVFQ